MTGSSPYRQARSHKAACQELHSHRAAGTQFDPAVVKALHAVIRSGSGPQAHADGATADIQLVLPGDAESPTSPTCKCNP